MLDPASASSPDADRRSGAEAGPSWLRQSVFGDVFDHHDQPRGADCRFYGITLLAGLQHCTARTLRSGDDRRRQRWQRFRFVTLPLLKPIILIVTLFSIIFTFADFQSRLWP